MNSPHVPQRLVQDHGSRVSRRILTDREIYERELEQIFGRAWILLGHESQLSGEGSFFRAWIGEDEIIVTRDRDARIHAHINACPHRGGRFCADDFGTTRNFVCPYHGWTFNLDGTLKGVPAEQQLYGGRLDKSKNGLTPVARLETFCGLIFATFDASGPSLDDFLGNVKPYLRGIFDRAPGGSEFAPGVQKWRIKANWKMACDNNAGDEYHLPLVHGTTMNALAFDYNQFLEDCIHISLPEGHGLSAHYELPDGAAEPVLPPEVEPAYLPETMAYYRALAPEAEKRVGHVHSRLRTIAGTVFPNFLLLPGLGAVRLVHPKGPNEFEVWSYCIVDKNAPPAVKADVLRVYGLTFGPAAIFEQDDSAIWEGVQAAAQGTVSRRQTMNVSMGLEDETWNESLGGWVTPRLSEAAQRGFYRRWSREIEGVQ